MYNPVLAMYDVRGIQDFVFRTARVKDAIGASRIVEDIISDALCDSVRKEKGITAALDWCGGEGPLPYSEMEAEKKQDGRPLVTRKAPVDGEKG